MSDRLCGYCRNEGHTMPRCPKRLGIIDAIRTYVPQERKRIAALLARNGYGNGALIEILTGYGEPEKKLCIVENIVPHDVSDIHVTYYAQRRSKQVRTTIQSVSGVHSENTHWLNIDFMDRKSVEITASPLDNMRIKLTGYIPLDGLEYPPENRTRESLQDNYRWYEPVTLVSPSYQCDIDDADLLSDIYVHKRLDKVTRHLGKKTW